MTMTLDELRRRRAQDMAALIDAQPAVSSDELADAEVPLPAVELLACSCRELAWLQTPGEIELIQRAATRTLQVPRATTGVVAPFEPSMLTVMYTARYFLATRAPSNPPSPRDTYVIYGARKSAVLPDALRIAVLAGPVQPT